MAWWNRRSRAHYQNGCPATPTAGLSRHRGRLRLAAATVYMSAMCRRAWSISWVLWSCAEVLVTLSCAPSTHDGAGVKDGASDLSLAIVGGPDASGSTSDRALATEPDVTRPPSDTNTSVPDSPNAFPAAVISDAGSPDAPAGPGSGTARPSGSYGPGIPPGIRAARDYDGPVKALNPEDSMSAEEEADGRY
jgi:hypothetical protein